MAKQQETNEQFVNIDWPSRGIDVTDEFAGQAPMTTVEAVNVRTFEAMTQRGRGGIRPGILRYIDARVGGHNSMIQHLNYIVDPQETALVAPSEIIGVDYIPDPSSNHLRVRNPGLGGGPGVERSVRRKGNGRQTNRKRPSGAAAKKTPIITWTPNVNILNYGIAIGADQLNAAAIDPDTSAPVAGAFVYTPASGATLGLGDRELDVLFTPTDGATYNTAMGNTTISIRSDGASIFGHGTSQSTPAADSDPVSATSVTLALNGLPEESYANVICVSRDPLNTGSRPGIGSLIGIEWVPASGGSVFPTGGVFYWTFTPV